MVCIPAYRIQPRGQAPGHSPIPFVNLDDEPGPDSDRAFLERNAIALLSNVGGRAIDPRRASWLGQYSQSAAIRDAGLWNVNHVEESFDPEFLDRLENAIAETGPL